MADHYIYSTLSSDNIYADFLSGGDGSPNTPVAQVLIKGGANVAQKRFVNDDGSIAPEGVVTAVNDAQLEILLRNTCFQDHVNGGYIFVSRSEEKVAKVVADMTEEDKSSQITPKEAASGNLRGAKVIKVKDEGNDLKEV